MKVIKGEDTNESLAAVDELRAVAEGLRGASVALFALFDSGAFNEQTQGFMTDAMNSYANRIEGVSSRLYSNVPRWDCAESEVNEHVGE